MHLYFRGLVKEAKYLIFRWKILLKALVFIYDCKEIIGWKSASESAALKKYIKTQRYIWENKQNIFFT